MSLCSVGGACICTGGTQMCTCTTRDIGQSRSFPSHPFPSIVPPPVGCFSLCNPPQLDALHRYFPFFLTREKSDRMHNKIWVCETLQNTNTGSSLKCRHVEQQFKEAKERKGLWKLQTRLTLYSWAPLIRRPCTMGSLHASCRRRKCSRCE